MRFISLLFLFFIFSEEVIAKKRSSFSGSEKSSFISKTKIPKSLKDTSFNKKKSEELGKNQNHFEYGKAVKTHNKSSKFNPIFVITTFFIFLIFIFYISLRKKNKLKSAVKKVKDLPLDLRVGGIVDISSVRSRLLLNKRKLEMKIPQNLKGYVQSVGFIELDSEIQIFNVSVSENIDDIDPEFYLQIEMMNKDISAVKLFTNYENIYPKNVLEWEEWLDGNEETHPNIGGSEFSIKSGTIYNRVWNSGSDEVVRSRFIEKIFTNLDEEKDIVSITSLYGREVEEEVEYLSISNIEDSEMNNFIQIKLGIAIREKELEIV